MSAVTITITHVPDELYEEPLFGIGTEFMMGHFASSLWMGCWVAGTEVEWEGETWVVKWNPSCSYDKSYDGTDTQSESEQWLCHADGTRACPTKNSLLSLVRQ